MNFDKEYTEYWESAVSKSIDGTLIAGINEAKYFLKQLDIKKSDKILDLGCSYGRMYDALSEFSDNVYGVEPDEFAVEKARLRPYKEVSVGSAESTGIIDNAFDAVFCWAVFDVVDHKKGLEEINRILKVNGKLLLTGKSGNYYRDDAIAFKAEKNAYLKKFPNKFTNLDLMLESFEMLGFELDSLYVFPRRGDFGLMNFLKKNIGDNINGYEYLILCHKISDYDTSRNINEALDGKFSTTATVMAKEKGLKSASALFDLIGLD